MSRYVFLDDGRIACVVTRDAVDSLCLLDRDGSLEDAGLAWTSYSTNALASDGSRVVFAAGSPTQPSSLVSFDAATGREEILQRSLDVELDPASISVPRAIEFPTGDGGTAHAFYYPPASAEYEGPEGEAPPLRVTAHGGPTAHVTPHLDIEVQYFAQRGIGTSTSTTAAAPASGASTAAS